MSFRRPRLSRGERRRMARLAAEEFLLSRGRPVPQVRLLEPSPTEPIPRTEPTPSPSPLPRDGSVLSVEDSKEILRQLAAGEIKQMRRR